MTVHGHQFSFRARSSRTAANCLTRATVKVKVYGLNLLISDIIHKGLRWTQKLVAVNGGLDPQDIA